MPGLAVEIEEVSFRYRGAHAPALRDVRLEIPAGERVLLTGPTGSGKSTLLRLMNGLIPHFHEGELTGAVRVLGADVRGARPSRLATRVGTVFQFPEEQVVASRVWRDVAFGLENLLVEPPDIASRVDAALAWAGLERLRDRETADLSGGEKQRMVLAAILAMGPELLLLDEPASELDPRARRDILRLVGEASASEERTLVLADHRLEDVVPLVDRVVVLGEGQVVLDGPPRAVLGDARLPALGVEVPLGVQVGRRLQEAGHLAGVLPLSLEEAAEALRNARREIPAGGPSHR